jgi:hypothetical protein
MLTNRIITLFGCQLSPLNVVLTALIVISQGTTRPTASNGFKSSGEFETCEECAVAKAGQKYISKNWSDSSMFLVNVFTLISVQRSKPLELNLNSPAQELHRGMERLKGSFRPFTEESNQC